MLLQNGVSFAQWPVKRLGGAACSERQQWGKSARLNWFWSEASPSRYLGVPSGYSAGSAWILPQRAGAIASRNAATVSLGAQAQAAAGVNGSGTAGLLFNAQGFGQLISSANGTASFSIGGGSGIVAASMFAAASTLAFSASATVSGLGWFNGTASCQVTGQSVRYGTGTMHGSTQDSGALTPASVAAAVWDSNGASYTAAGSMGQKLNNAASGGVDYAALSNAVWSHAEAAQMHTLLAETWGRLGLDKDKPLLTGQTQISFGQIVLAMAETTNSVIVTRQ